MESDAESDELFELSERLEDLAPEYRLVLAQRAILRALPFWPDRFRKGLASDSEEGTLAALFILLTAGVKSRFPDVVIETLPELGRSRVSESDLRVFGPWEALVELSRPQGHFSRYRIRWIKEGYRDAIDREMNGIVHGVGKSDYSEETVGLLFVLLSSEGIGSAFQGWATADDVRLAERGAALQERPLWPLVLSGVEWPGIRGTDGGFSQRQWRAQVWQLLASGPGFPDAPAEGSRDSDSFWLRWLDGVESGKQLDWRMQREIAEMPKSV